MGPVLALFPGEAEEVEGGMGISNSNLRILRVVKITRLARVLRVLRIVSLGFLYGWSSGGSIAKKHFGMVFLVLLKVIF